MGFLPGDAKLSPAGPVNAPPAENPAATAFAADEAAVGVSLPPPTAELNMNAPVDIDGDELFPRVNCANAELLPRMLPIPANARRRTKSNLMPIARREQDGRKLVYPKMYMSQAISEIQHNR